MNKKGALGLIIGIVVAVLVIGGVSYFAFSGNSDDDIVNGSSGVGSGSGESGGTSGSSESNGDISIWCYQLGPGVGSVVGIENYRGVQTCHTQKTVGPTTKDFYFISHSTNSDNYWNVDSYAGLGGKYETHYNNGKCIEYSCSSYSGDAKLSCEQVLSVSCGGTEVN